MKPSKYQTAIYKAFQLTKKDLNISAVAGSGKTTVLLELLKFIPKNASSLFLAFNNSIVDELKDRNTNRSTTIMTVHSCGWRAIRLPLSVSYRCAKNIVIEAQKYVPEISWAPGAEEGVVRNGSLTDIEEGDWVLCRNLKPLIQAYLWLLKNHIKSKIRGKDIAEGILGLINKTGAKTIDGLFNALQRERNHLLDKLTKKGVRRPSQHPKMELLEQKVDVIECLADEVNTVSELKEMISSIFSDDVKGIMLSTIHKAKGLENDRVFFLLPELIPSKYATQDWQYEQERNLKYVGITRAKRELIYVWDADFKSDLENRVIITNSKTRRI